MFGVAIAALLLLSAWELVLALPVPPLLYVANAALFALALVSREPAREQRGALTLLAVALALIAALHFVPWTTRKPFLHKLDRIQLGMTEAQAREIMAGYMEGTRVPALAPAPGATPRGEAGIIDSYSGIRYPGTVSASGEISLNDALVFRHSNSGRFNMDWGIVTLHDGRVVSVEFSPD